MIKLNNKNITYVALADSNNSLKAPKEIWYADSSNSVKLVYRRKDALIEGEDYEKYHWLCSDAAYIDTNIIPQFEDELYATVTASGTPSVSNIGFITAADDNNNITIATGGGWMSNGTPQLIAITRPFVDAFTVWNTNVLGSAIKEYYIYSKIKNGLPPECYVIANGENCGEGEVLGNNTITSTPSSTYKIAYYVKLSREITQGLNVIKLKSAGINNHLFIPCKLLKPVPKWLDANGIRRQVGECGMIDLISGKFYGNVNSVGTFTVENYYERKEWLVGDGSAYIDTDIIVNVTTLRYSLKFVHDAYNMAFLCGSRHSNTHDGDSTALVFDNIHNDKIRLDAISSGLLYSNIMLNEPNEVLIDCQTNSAIVNNSSIAGNRTKFNNSPYTFRIFDAYPKSTPDTCTCKISYFTLSDSTHSLNLIPCTLTMDLPASMDANNIARTKGTSGMWDLVSDKFYGNVANSGTFKAVNLAEGVDYEVHDWLVAEILPGRHLITLPINSENFSYSREYTQIGNTAHLQAPGHTYFSGNLNSVLIWDGSQTINNIVMSITNLDIVCTSDRLLINSREFPKYGTPMTVTLYNASSSSVNTICKQSKVIIDDVVHYVPVKLLRSIPSKYDANGRARQAGECGMYDTVNDVFYGNVASSGTFSVSDDN